MPSERAEGLRTAKFPSTTCDARLAHSAAPTSRSIARSRTAPSLRSTTRQRKSKEVGRKLGTARRLPTTDLLHSFWVPIDLLIWGPHGCAAAWVTRTRSPRSARPASSGGVGQADEVGRAHAAHTRRAGSLARDRPRPRRRPQPPGRAPGPPAPRSPSAHSSPHPAPAPRLGRNGLARGIRRGRLDRIPRGARPWTGPPRARQPAVESRGWARQRTCPGRQASVRQRLTGSGDTARAAARLQSRGGRQRAGAGLRSPDLAGGAPVAGAGGDGDAGRSGSPVLQEPRRVARAVGEPARGAAGEHAGGVRDGKG